MGKALTKEQWDKQGLYVPEPQTREEKIELITSLEEAPARINVCTASGCSKWRKPAEVLESDIIVLKKKDDSPSTMGRAPGNAQENLELPVIDMELERIKKVREEFIRKDALVRTARTNLDDPISILRETQIKLTENAASLTFARMEAERKGEESSMIAKRELAALRAIRDLALRREDQKLKKQEIDLGSLTFKNMLSVMISTFFTAMVEGGLTQDEANTIINGLAKKLDSEEWQSRMSKAISQ